MKKLISLLVFVIFLGCGKTEEKKDYRILVETDNVELIEIVKTLANHYNNQLGSNVLSIVNQGESYNSSIGFIDGLDVKENKLGYGSSSKTTTYYWDDSVLVEHSLEVVFDLRSFTRRMAYINDPNSDGFKFLYHLFCHEIGHGLRMNHEDVETSIMYYAIPIQPRDNLDYSDYFEKIRHFLYN